jgi:hypothetical protein
MAVIIIQVEQVKDGPRRSVQSPTARAIQWSKRFLTTFVVAIIHSIVDHDAAVAKLGICYSSTRM